MTNSAIMNNQKNLAKGSLLSTALTLIIYKYLFIQKYNFTFSKNIFHSRLFRSDII